MPIEETEDDDAVEKAARAHFQYVATEVMDGLARVFPNATLVLLVQAPKLGRTAIMTHGHMPDLENVLRDTLERITQMPPAGGAH